MSHLRVKGFVLSSIPYGENNRLIRILTPDRGILLCSARGAARMKSPLRSVTDPFVFAEFELFHYRERFHVNSGQGIAWFLNLREDIDRLTCAAHLAEVFLDGLKDSEPIPAAYELWAYTAHRLGESADPLLDVHIAQLRFLAEIGFRPAVTACKHCGREDGPMYFSFRDGAVFCADGDCKRQIGEGEILPLSEGAIAAVDYVTAVKPERLFHLELSRSVRHELIAFSERYLTYIMEKQYRRLQLLKDLDAFQFEFKSAGEVPAEE